MHKTAGIPGKHFSRSCPQKTTIATNKRTAAIATTDTTTTAKTATTTTTETTKTKIDANLGTEDQHDKEEWVDPGKREKEKILSN